MCCMVFFFIFFLNNFNRSVISDGHPHGCDEVQHGRKASFHGQLPPGAGPNGGPQKPGNSRFADAPLLHATASAHPRFQAPSLSFILTDLFMNYS